MSGYSGAVYSGAVYRVAVLMFLLAVLVDAGKEIETVGACKVLVDGRLINLESLQNTDGTPR